MTQSGQPGAPPPPPSSPPPPPPPAWQSAPQQPSTPPPAGQPMSQGMPAWTAAIMDKTPVAGPAGYFYADLPNRIIALIIDGIALGIVGFILAIISRMIFGANAGPFSFDTTTSLIVTAILSGAASAAYFIYMWSMMRGTIGMRVLGMQIGDQTDGHTINYMQAAYRWAFMWGPYYAALLIVAFVSLTLGALAYLVALAWFIYLLYTTAISPTKQGLHDKYAKTMIVKAARGVA